MPIIAQNRITAVYPNPDDYTVRLEWKNGAETVFSFRHLVGRGVLQSMQDRAFFAKASPERDGRVLSWPGALDFSADGLWFAAHPEDVPRNMQRNPLLTPEIS